MAHYPRKRFGQNFLQDPSILQAILRTFDPQPNDHVIEIGPGLGALTELLFEKLSRLTAIEIDRDLFAHLTQTFSKPSRTFNLIQADALTIDFSQFGSGLRIIGNLPYNISTPLLFHLIKYQTFIHDMLFMLQKEVVERLIATPGHKTYGRLSIMIQSQFEVHHLFDVPSTAFHPQPKVESAIIVLRPHQNTWCPWALFDSLERVVTMAFSTRRKTLANNLKPLLTSDELASLGIDPMQRAEQICIQKYIQLAKYISK